MAPSRPRQRIEFGAAIVFRVSPLGGDQAVVLELVERGVERAVADLESVGRDFAKTVADRPPVHRLQREHLEDEHVEGALNEIVRLAHQALMSVTEMSVRSIGRERKSKSGQALPAGSYEQTRVSRATSGCTSPQSKEYMD